MEFRSDSVSCTVRKGTHFGARQAMLGHFEVSEFKLMARPVITHLDTLIAQVHEHTMAHGFTPAL